MRQNITGRGLLEVAVRFALPLALLVLLGGLLVGCEALEGLPDNRDPMGRKRVDVPPLPSGAHLYCITNVEHTLAVYSIAQDAVLHDRRVHLPDLDTVGPWFAGDAGYYLSRVDGSGAGSNALVRFDPITLRETGRYNFPANSNPNSLFLLPSQPGIGWVALRGSTFDRFATNGIAIMALGAGTPMRQAGYADLNALAALPGETLTSLLGFVWDAAGCGAGCAWALVNNFDGALRDGVLLQLAPNPDPALPPAMVARAALGRNALWPFLLAPDGALWVVNNGGYMHYDPTGQPGFLQIISAANPALDPDLDGLPGETLPLAEPTPGCSPLPAPDPGCDPSAVYAFDGTRAWVATYPHNVLRVARLDTHTLEDVAFSPAPMSGPLFSAPSVTAIGLGSYGVARLGILDAATGTLLGEHDLQAGRGPLGCAEHTVP